MYELIPLSQNNYYIESPAKVGVVVEGTDAYLVDSGNDKDAGKKILKVLNAHGWTLRAIFNTHYHADHIGGNCYLQQNTGCKIYATGMEAAFIRDPILEPTLLYGGNPPEELRHKFLMAKESDVLPLTPDCLPAGMEIISLPGHSFEMVGFRTAEGTVYLADALSSVETLEKYKIVFISDVAAYLSTLEEMKTLHAERFVPAHAAVVEDIAPLAEENVRRVKAVAEGLVTLCQTPVTFEELLQKVFERYELAMTFEQYALIGSTLRSYLTYLKNEGRMTASIEDARMLWKSI